MHLDLACTFTVAENAYRSRNQRLGDHNMHHVHRCWKESMAVALKHFRGQEWVCNMIGNIQYKVFAHCILHTVNTRSEIG